MPQFLEEMNRFLDRFLTPAVKTIFLINVIVTIVLIVLGSLTGGGLIATAVTLFGQSPAYSLARLHVWQFLTYMFLHVEVFHLLFNMLVLWFFAPSLENRWGSRRFWSFYLTAGIGAGVLHAAITLLTGNPYAIIIGASGAIYGVMLAFACYYPEQVVMVWGIFPMKIKHLMILMIFIEFLSTSSSHAMLGNSQVSNLTHLTGLGMAYIWLSLFHKDWDFRHWRWR